MVVMGVLILRIAKISTEGISQSAAATQSRRTFELYETRAGIFDRNLEPLVNRNLERRLLVFPDILDISVIGDFFDRDFLAEEI